ncbi:MAG: glycoside hydrolase family 10 protein [Prevotella sp.]
MRVSHLFRYKACLLFCLLAITAIDAKGADSDSYLLFSAPKREVRAVWLTTLGGLDWPRTYSKTTTSRERQQRELCQILDRLKEAGINTILLQTRIRATTIYPSLYEPWDGCLSGIPGKSPQYDALQFAVEACHQRGMELHAWVVALPAGKWKQKGCTNLRKKHPRMMKKVGEEGFLNPEYEGTADYLADICREIVSNYDVDGIHLDYIRYPESWPNKRMGNKERSNITRIVSHIHTSIKREKPWVKLSCSPIGKHDDLARYSSKGWNSFGRVGQDAQAWVKLGLMDHLYPMLYFKENDFYPFLLDWTEQCGNSHVVAGLAAYMLSPGERNWAVETIVRQLQIGRSWHTGYALFRARFFLDDTKGIYSFVKNHFNCTLALAPPMSNGNRGSQPLPPEQVRLMRTADDDRLCWRQETESKGGNYLLYNIYASPQEHFDTEDSRWLIATRVSGNQIQISRRSGKIPMNYAVTAMDRYGNESTAVYVN